MNLTDFNNVFYHPHGQTSELHFPALKNLCLFDHVHDCSLLHTVSYFMKAKLDTICLQFWIITQFYMIQRKM